MVKYEKDGRTSFPVKPSAVQGDRRHDSDKRYGGETENNEAWRQGDMKGQSSGKAKLTWPNGSCYEGEFLNDMRHGVGKNKWASGEEYEGEFCKDQRHGKGIYRWPDGSEYHGTFYLGRKEGYGKLIFSNGDVFEGLHKKDERYGPGIVTYKNSKKQDIGLWYKEKLIRLCSVVDDIFTIKDHPEYQYFPEEHFLQMTQKEVDYYSTLLKENEKMLQFMGKKRPVTCNEENFLPDGIEHYCHDFEHLPLTSSFRESLDKAFFKDNFHLVKTDEDATFFARNNTPLLMDVQKQMHRHRHAAEAFNVGISSIDGAPRSVFHTRQGPLEKMSEDLIIAAASGDEKTVYTILKSGSVNPNVCDNAGNTPILGAAINCHSRIVNLLLDMGANIDHVNDEGISALNACLVFYYPSDHFKPNIAEKYINEYGPVHFQKSLFRLCPGNKDSAFGTKWGRPDSPLTIDEGTNGGKERRHAIISANATAGRERRGSITSANARRGRERSGSISPVTSPISLFNGAEQDKKNAMELCRSDMKIKARFRQISSARQEEIRQKKWEEEQKREEQLDEGESLSSEDSFQSTSVDTTLASKRNLIDFYMDVPEDLIERTATLLSTNRRAVSGISTRDGQAIVLGTTGALAVWKSEHEELRQMIELLLQRGASPNKSAVPMPPLFFAVKAGDTDAVRLLLLRGASTETRISSQLGGFTPLHIASAISGKDGVRTVTLLLQAGADPNSTAHDENIPHSQEIAPSTQAPADLTVPAKKAATQWMSQGLKEVEEGGRTPLHIACDRDDDYEHASEVVHELLDNGADPDVIWSGHSPLSLTVCSGNDLALDELLAFGADASMPLKRGVGNALCAAANTAFEERRTPDDRIKLVDKLVNAGASMLAPIFFGRRLVAGSVVDYAHWMFGRDLRIAHTPYHALTYQERDTYNARKRLLAHFGNLLREAAVKVERDKLRKEAYYGVRSTSPSRSNRFIYVGAGATAQAPTSSLLPRPSAEAPANRVCFPDRASPEDRPASKLSTILSQPETELKPAKVKVVNGRKGFGPIRKPLFRYCYECGRSIGVRLTACSRCREVYYCGRSCKLKAWEDRHKSECLRMKSNREQVSPSPAEIASYFTVQTLKEAISNGDQLVDSVKILPKSIVRNTEFLPITMSERIASKKTKHSKVKAKKKTGIKHGGNFPHPLGRAPQRKARVAKDLQAKVGKEAFFGTTGLTLAELGIEENYSLE